MADDDDDDGSEAPRRRRPPSMAYREKIDAVAVVAPISERLALWSPRVSFLRAMSGRPGMDTNRAEATAMLGDVRAARDQLAERCTDLPPAIASHGRILDARRSLDALEAQLLEIVGQPS